MNIEIEDTLHHKSTLGVTITTPKDRTRYNEAVVVSSAKQLVAALFTHTSSGFCRALEDELHTGRKKPSNILEAE